MPINDLGQSWSLQFYCHKRNNYLGPLLSSLIEVSEDSYYTEHLGRSKFLLDANCNNAMSITMQFNVIIGLAKEKQGQTRNCMGLHTRLWFLLYVCTREVWSLQMIRHLKC